MTCHDKEAPVQMLVHQVLHLMTYKAEKLLDKYRLKRGQAGILFVLEVNPDVSQKELADLIGVKPPTITAALKKMETLGYIVREQDAEDQRILRLRNTEAGSACVGSIKATMKEMEGIMYQGMSREEILLFRRLLQEIRDNLLRQDEFEEAAKNETFV